MTNKPTVPPISDADLAVIQRLLAAYGDANLHALIPLTVRELAGLLARLRAAEAAVQHGHIVADEFIGRQM